MLIQLIIAKSKGSREEEDSKKPPIIPPKKFAGRNRTFKLSDR